MSVLVVPSVAFDVRAAEPRSAPRAVRVPGGTLYVTSLDAGFRARRDAPVGIAVEGPAGGAVRLAPGAGARWKRPDSGTRLSAEPTILAPDPIDPQRLRAELALFVPEGAQASTLPADVVVTVMPDGAPVAGERSAAPPSSGGKR